MRFNSKNFFKAP